MTTHTALSLTVASTLACFAACGGSTVPEPRTATEPRAQEPPPREEATAEPPTKMPPPESGPARDIAFPPIQRASLDNGLELNTVEWHQLPVVYLRLVVKSGAETDPENLQGLSSLVAQMLKEGTRRRSSAQLAEHIEFLGADLWTGADEENVHLVFRALSEHLDEAMDILAEVATQPAFRPQELDKLKRRERDRLSMMQKRPNFLARRTFYRELYGDHPYGRFDTTEEVLRRVRRADLVRWHRRHFVPSNAFLVAVGDVTPERVQQAATAAFGRWSGRPVPPPEFPELRPRTRREVFLVDRPGAVQSVILLGNLGVARRDPDYIPLIVANQVLGGSAASRLFMDLRERRSLTYGAYSQIGERVDVAPFVAWAAVRTEVTHEAVDAFFENLERIVTEPAPAGELRNAQRYLSDSFPLQIDTPGKVAGMVADLRIFGLPDDYWTTFRTRIAQVTPHEALQAARHHIHPDKMLVVVVGEAGQIADGLRRWGPVTILDEDGAVQQQLEPRPATSGEGESGGSGDSGDSDASNG